MHLFFQVVQMVSLMDRLLKSENLDLHLTPYKVLATGQDEGMLEFIPSSSLAQVPYITIDNMKVQSQCPILQSMNEMICSTI